MTAQPVRALLRGLAAGDVGAVESLEACLARIAARPGLGAIEHLDEEEARAQARAADRRLAAGERAPLLGLPVLVKDVIDVAGMPTRAGTAAWSRRPSSDAAVVAAWRAAGAVVIGKGHTNELAYGIDGRNPHRPPCRNPHDPERLPGGSSSGPAVAVAAGLAVAALGTDTSGSLRVPAAFCGVAALRPTAGRVSRAGIVPLAPTYDVPGPMAPAVAGLAELFAAMRPREGAAARSAGGAAQRVGSLRGAFPCEPAVDAAVRRAEAALEAAGIVVEPLSLPGLADAHEVHIAIQRAEASAGFAALGVDEGALAPDVRARIAAGRQIGEDAVRDAQRRRRALVAEVDAALGDHDALLAPSSPVVAPQRDAERVAIGGEEVGLREALMSWTVPLTQGGWPVLALPAGDAGGLPAGVQLAGRRGEDEALIALGERVAALLA